MSSFSSEDVSPCDKRLNVEGLAGATFRSSDGEGISSKGRHSVVVGRLSSD